MEKLPNISAKANDLLAQITTFALRFPHPHMTYQSFREKVNLKIYNSKDRVLHLLRWSSFVVALTALATLIYSYGFPKDPEGSPFTLWIIRGSFTFYVLHYALRIIYTFDVPGFLKESWFEGLMMLLIVIDGISSYLFRFPLVQVFFFRLGFENITDLYVVFVQIYLLVIIGIELNKTTFNLFLWHAGPVRLLVTSYLCWIGLGALLLMLPECSTGSSPVYLHQALFTSLSSVTLCGLSIIDVPTVLTFKGQLIVLFLIQVGGINILAFTTYLASQYVTDMKKQSLIEDFQSADRLFSKDGILRRIILIVLLIEILGSISLFFLWGEEMPFASSGEKIFYSIFHSVSAFNNAGFTLFTGGFQNPMLAQSFILHMMIALLVFAGALGYLPLVDLFGIRNLRNRMQHPWKRIRITTRLALYSSLFLALAGGAVFYILERTGSLQDMNLSERSITSVFMTVNRSGGFSTVDFGSGGQSLLLFFVFLMFVGGSSGSVAGGVKTSTFTAVLLSALATIRGTKAIHFHRFYLPFEVFSRAFSIITYTAGCIILGTFFLSLTDPHFPVLSILFEQVSAISLSGLSSGITPRLSQEGQYILLASMMLGRVGLLLLLHALARKRTGQRYRYPRAQILVG